MYWELFAEPLQRRYRSDCWSLATWFTVAVWLTRLLLPAYIAWQTKNLWVKDLTYVEQPYVSFQNQLIVEAHNAGWSGTSGGAGVPVVINSPTGVLPYTLVPIAWSSIDAYQRIVGYARGRQPSVRASAVDTNHDQKPDRLNVTITVPKRSDVHSVSVVLLFDVELSGQVLLNMQSAVTLSAADAQSCSHVYFTGDLHFSQRSPIAVGTRRVIYNTPIVDAANITSIDDVLIPNIQAIAQTRNETLVVERAATHWVGGGQFSDNFVIHIALTIPPQRIRYTPGLGEVLKNGWIQWLALFAIVYGITWWITHWLYAHRILDVAYSDDVNPVGRPFINY